MGLIKLTTGANMDLSTKNQTITLNQKFNFKEVIFSHWEKKHGNGMYWFDIEGNKYSISDII